MAVNNTTPIIKTWQLDKIRADYNADLHISELKAAQFTFLGLAYNCPQCGGNDVTAGTGRIEVPDAGNPGQTVAVDCPLCSGMGKTTVPYLKVCTAYGYQPADKP